MTFNYVVWEDQGAAELYIDRKDETENKALFDPLIGDRSAIESSFGDDLEWERLDGKRAARIRKTIPLGGYKSPEENWPALQVAMVDAMVRLEAALAPHLAQIKSRAHSADGSVQ